MSHRARIAFVSVATILGCGRVERAEAPRLVVGAPAPAALAARDGEEVVVGWVVRPEQLRHQGGDRAPAASLR